MNRAKFGAESIFLTPFVYGIGKSAKLLASRGKDLAYSDSRFARWLDKYVRAPFSPRGGLTEELFDEENVKKALMASDQGRAKEIVDNITKEVDSFYPDAENIINKSGKAERTKFGIEHSFNKIKNYGDFKRLVPDRKYEELFPYIDEIRNGKKNILWPNSIKLFSISSYILPLPCFLSLTQSPTYFPPNVYM